MSDFIPPFDAQAVLVQPWTDDFSTSLWVVLMGFLITVGCGLVGIHLLLRRMALVGDAISHSILPGLIVAFILFKQVNTPAMFAGALAAGLVTVFLIEFIHRQSRIKPDAAICIAFTVLFAIGVALMSSLETKGSVHIDAECVLYGEIAFVALEPPLVWSGIEWGPPSVLRMGLVVAAVLLVLTIFYKEWLVTSFDPGLSTSMGLRTKVWHYGLMGLLSIVVVAAFESVGAILAVAMLIVPPMFAAQLSDRMVRRMVIVAIHSLLSSLLGYHLSLWLGCSTAGGMVVAASLLFLAAWLATSLHRLTLRHPAPSAVPDGPQI